MVKGRWERTVQADFGPLAITVTYNVDGDSLTGTLASAWGQVGFSDCTPQILIGRPGQRPALA